MDDDEINHDENIITLSGEAEPTLHHSSQSMLKDLGLELSSVRDSQEKVLAYKEN